MRLSKHNEANPSADQTASEGPSDEELMEHYLAGDARSFQTLMERYGSRIYNFIVRQTGDRQLAEDLVQDVFLRLVHSAGSFRKQAKFSTWLYTIARNLCIDHGRKARHRRIMQLDEPLRKGDERGASLLDRAADKGPGPDRKARDLRFRAALTTALDSLPEEQREVYVMRELQGLKFREIADVVGVPENTIKSRMRYALQQLREHLADFE